MHPQLEQLHLLNMNIGRNESTALATLLRSTTKHLQTLIYVGTKLDNEGVHALVNAIDGIKLRWIRMGMPDCNLEKLFLRFNNIA